MAIPSWTYPSNSNLGTYDERTLVSIPILVFDTGDISDPRPPFNETHMFNNYVDSSKLPNYSDSNFFYIKSNGLPQTALLGQPSKVNKFSPIAHNYVFKIPRDQRTINGENTSVVSRRETDTSTRGFFGVAIDGVPFKSPDSGIIASINDKNYTENAALYPITQYQDDSSDPWGPFADGSGVILSDKKFFYHTDPRFLYEKDPTKHSPVIGYAFDGCPIYGPFGYANPTPADLNNPGQIKIMKSSYRLTEVQRSNQSMPDGLFIEDFEYIQGLGDLDQYNGRFCKTPEYPGGTYAYFVTVDEYEPYLPRYPYIIGPKFKYEPLIPNGIFKFPGDINLEVISGQIPPGLRIEGLNIVGTPFEVSKRRTFRFVLRAKNVSGLSDRTYSITIEGADAPTWTTPPGDLEVGSIGTRTESVERILAVTANAGDNSIILTSTRGVLKNSIITAVNYPNGFFTPTRTQFIDPRTRTIDLWEGRDIGGVPRETTVKSTIPAGARIRFTTTYTHINLFVLDNEYVNYQLSAVDNDLPTGENLTYYIPPRGGTLPPGLTLSPNGIISGFTEPILANEQGDINGAYDMHLYDKFAYDYGVRPYNGYDSFLFDTTTFDYSDETRNPRKLNRYYSFRVRVSDGLNYADRVFRIYVIGDDFFRADNTLMEVGTKTYTADITPIRKPIWLTPAYLGKRRANNYITTYLDTFDSSTLRGIISYVLDPVNNDGTISQLPPGMILDQITGEIYGDVPYQPAVTKTYKFTVRAIRYDPDNPMYGYARLTSDVNPIGQYTLKLESVLDLRLDSLVIGPSGEGYITPGSIITAIDPATKTITLNTPLLKTVPSGERFTFNFVVSSAKTFTIDIIGEIDSTIRFITDGDLGTIPANYISELSIEATSTVKNAVLNYTLIGGKLPPGLFLVNDGTVQGKVTQFSDGIYKSFWVSGRSYVINDIVRVEDKYFIAISPNQTISFDLTYWVEYEFNNNGLTTFDQNDTILDDFTTTIDRDYTFIVLAKDQFDYSAVTKIFTVSVTTPNNLLYSNIYVKPFLKTSKRLELTDFFTNPDIFELDKIYRPSDPEFGVQNELKMLLYAGIETKAANEYVSALGRSSKKRYRFGSVKKAIAKKPGTNEVVYEAVYIEVLDNMENSKGSIPKFIPYSRYQNFYDNIPRKVVSGTVEPNKIVLNSLDGVSVGDPVYVPDDSSFISQDTIIVEINKKSKTISLSKPLLKSIPAGTYVTFNTPGIKINQKRRDLWDSDKFTETYSTSNVPEGSFIIPVSSNYELKRNDIIQSKSGNYFQKDTSIIDINNIDMTIIIDKPLIKDLPMNMRLMSDRDLLPRIWTQDKVMSADYDGQLVSDYNKTNLFGNSTTNIRKNIQAIGETERNFLPLWMRTAQSFSGVEQGFTRGILLCYAKPGQGDRIINNIKNLGIDFKTIDFTVDRIIIDSVKGEIGDKYIAFPAREIING